MYRYYLCTTIIMYFHIKRGSNEFYQIALEYFVLKIIIRRLNIHISIVITEAN